MLMLRITGLNGLGEDLVKAEYVRVEYLYALDLYLIGTSIGVKKSQDSRNSQVAKQWRKWAVRFINAKKECTARLVRILGYDSLEEVFGYQVTIAMLRPLSFHLLRLARLKKPCGKDRCAPNNSGMKYGTDQGTWRHNQVTMIRWLLWRLCRWPVTLILH